MVLATTTIYSNTAVVSVTNPLITTATTGTDFTFTASSGTTLLSFSIASGSLPASLNLATTGVVIGTPTQAGTFLISLTVTDNLGCAQVASPYNLIVNCPGLTASITTSFNSTLTCMGEELMM